MVWATPLICVTVAVLCIINVSMTYANVEIKKNVFNTNGVDSYSFEYQTSDGAYRREDGGIKSVNEGLAVRGEYGYIDPMGHSHTVRYVADVNGFRPRIYDDVTRFNDRNII